MRTMAAAPAKKIALLFNLKVSGGFDLPLIRILGSQRFLWTAKSVSSRRKALASFSGRTASSFLALSA